MPRTKPTAEPQLVTPPPETNGPTSDVYTLREAAAYLRLTEQEVLRLVREQGLPARSVGSEWRFLKAAIQQWLSTGSPTLQAEKQRQLALAGKYKDDPDLLRICEDAYRQRRASAAGE